MANKTLQAMLSGEEARAAEVAAELDATRLFLLEEGELKVGSWGTLPGRPLCKETMAED